MSRSPDTRLEAFQKEKNMIKSPRVTLNDANDMDLSITLNSFDKNQSDKKGFMHRKRNSDTTGLLMS
jgi:hypothetical protein